METAIQQFSTMPSTSDEVIRFSEKLREELMSGNHNPLDLAVIRKSLLTVFDNIKGDLDTLAIEEAAKYEKVFSYRGVKIERSSTSKYNYEHCGHPEYNRLKSRIKELETFLKTITGPMQIADESTEGELVSINPPLKSTTDFLKLTLK